MTYLPNFEHNKNFPETSNMPVTNAISEKSNELIYRKVQKCWFWPQKRFTYSILGINIFVKKKTQRMYFLNPTSCKK